MGCELTENRFSVVEDVMAKIGVFDLCSFFWTVAGTRKRGEDPYGLALQVLRYIKACADKVGVEDVIFGADGPSGRSFRRAVCPDYKAGREAKDPEHREELDALAKALLDAGFTVHSAVEGERTYVPMKSTLAEPGPVTETVWFEGDDVVASFTATILKDPSAEVLVGSNDWDLAPLLAFPKVRLFTTRGEERTAADVKREFGVEPLMLPQLKALAGDSDGYKPFPGLEKGKPGIGDKTAAAILERFGSAEAAVKAAFEPDATAIPKFGALPHRLITLLRAGGEKALAMGLTCARLRTDAPVPTDISFGEWADVEKALLDRQKAQQSESRPEPVASPADAAKAFQEAAHEQLTKDAALKSNEEDVEREAEARLASKIGPEGVEEMRRIANAPRDPVCPRCLGVEPGKPAGDPEHPHPGPFTAEVCAACEDVLSKPIAVTPLSVGRPIEAFRDNPVTAEPYAEGDGPPFMAGSDMRDAGGIAAIEERRAATRKRRSKAAPTPPIPDLDSPAESVVPVEPAADPVFVLLTEAEFIAVAPLPSLAAAGFLTPPEAFAEDFAALLSALRNGLFEPRGGLFVGSVPEACGRALSKLAETTQNEGTAVGDWAVFIDQLRVLPRFTDLAKYGGKLVRA